MVEAVGFGAGALPNLVIVGAMKCGTTSLHEYLDRHPDIQMSRPKEVNFFSGGNAERPLEWYTSLFDPASKVRGESSQNYAKRHHPVYGIAPERMGRTIPNAKLIYLVRDPIERYKSHKAYNFYTISKAEHRFNHSIDHYIKTGLYYFQMQRFLEYYSREQIMIVDAHDLRHNRFATMSDIFAFLGIRPLEDPSAFDFVTNEHGEQGVPVRVRVNLLYRVANRVAPGLLAELMRCPAVQERMMRAGGAKTLTTAEEAALRVAHKEDVEALKALAGRDFAHWSV